MSKRTAADVEADERDNSRSSCSDIFFEGEGAPDAEYRLDAAIEQIKRIIKTSKSGGK